MLQLREKRWSDWVKYKNNYVLLIKETSKIKRCRKSEQKKRVKKIYWPKSNQKEVGAIILRSENVDFKPKSLLVLWMITSHKKV